MKKFCFVCNKSFPIGKGQMIKHTSGQIREVHKGCAKNLIKDKFAKRKDEYVEIQLPSEFLRRTEYNDLGYSFYGILTDTFLDSIGGNKGNILDTNLAKLREK